MAILGYYRVPVAGGVLEVPIAALGEGPGPPILRAPTPRGTGQLGLVDRGDVRASGLTVQTHRGLYAIAKDVRTRIDHVGPWRGYGGWGATWASVYLGRTAFNRVTRIEMVVGAALPFETYARFSCDAVHIGFDPQECIWAHVRIRAGSYVSAWQVDRHACTYHYGEFQSNYGTVHLSGTAVLSGLPPGQYDVWGEMESWVTQEGSGAGVTWTEILVTSWSEIA